MSSQQAYSYYYPSAPVPISQPQKQPQQGSYYNPYYPQQHGGYYGQMAASPPESAQSGTTSGVPSYDPSATSSSYAASASASDYETSASGQSVDLYEYMGQRLEGQFDPMPLDRSLVKQAQTSGQLNAKTQELMDLQELARKRLAAMQTNFADGMKAAKEVQRDLDWTQKRVTSINQRAAKKYPEQYAMASSKYPNPTDY